MLETAEARTSRPGSNGAVLRRSKATRRKSVAHRSNALLDPFAEAVEKERGDNNVVLPLAAIARCQEVIRLQNEAA